MHFGARMPRNSRNSRNSSNVQGKRKCDIFLVSVFILVVAFSSCVQIAGANKKADIKQKSKSVESAPQAKNQVDLAAENELIEDEEEDGDGQEEPEEPEKKEKAPSKGAGAGMPMPKDPVKVLGLAPKVRIDQGELVGLKLAARGGREYFAYRQVPYATPVRFAEAIPSPKFQGVFNATQHLCQCPQILPAGPPIQFGNEDCLKLSVYTPNISGERKLPVMVYMHSGAFQLGSADSHNADYFMENGDVVLVTINYRLGALGLLSTGDTVIPGNFALKDCVLALKWVRRNIGHFGGLTESVTIFGNSAGSIIGSYLLLSPQGKGLFHAAILQSGTALMAVGQPRKGLLQTKKFAQAIGCPFSGAGVGDSKQFLKCLESKTQAEILTAQRSLVVWGIDPFVLFGPVLEPKGYKNAFITQNPQLLLTEGRINRVPVIVGQTEDEGFLVEALAVLSNATLLQDFNENWRKVFPITFNYDKLNHPDMSEKERNRISETIRQVYFHDQPVTQENADDLTDAYSDLWFNYGIRKFARLLAQHTDVYLYYFAHKRQDFFIYNLVKIPSNDTTTVTHLEDAPFLFNSFSYSYPDFKRGSAQEQFSKTFVKLWVSFATNGEPTHMWRKVDHWSPISRKEYKGKRPLKFLRMDFQNHIMLEPHNEFKRHKLLDQMWEALSSRNEKLRKQLFGDDRGRGLSRSRGHRHHSGRSRSQ